MKFLKGLGRVVRSTGRTIGNIAGAIKTVADNPTVRSIGSIVGSVGSKAMPLLAGVVGAQPELAPVYGAASKAFGALKSGSAFDTVDKYANKAANIGQKITTAGANFT